MEYVLIGKIVNTFGIKGELKLESYTDFADERFAKDSLVYISESHLPFAVLKHREYKGMLLVTLKDNEDINLVERYKGMNVYKSKDDIKPLKEGEYYFSDLKNLDVYVEDKKVGKVLRVEEGMKYNFLRILKDEDNKEILVPYLESFVKNVSLENGTISIIKMEGLL